MCSKIQQQASINRARRKDAKSVKIKQNSENVNMKVHCSRLLYTLIITDKEKAEKLKQSLQPVKSRSSRNSHQQSEKPRSFCVLYYAKDGRPYSLKMKSYSLIAKKYKYTGFSSQGMAKLRVFPHRNSAEKHTT